MARPATAPRISATGPSAGGTRKTLETFPNPAPQRDYQIHMEIPEFTCLCPKTDQPDFATLTLDYVADRQCVELKSLKLYIWSFRDEGHFHQCRRGAPQVGMEAGAAHRTCRVSGAIEHPRLRATRSFNRHRGHQTGMKGTSRLA